MRDRPDPSSDDHPDGADTPPLDEVLELLGQEIQHGTGRAEPHVGAIVPAGHVPPTPANLDDIAIAHAIDGDGTALCQPDLLLEQVDGYHWSDVPPEQRCPFCTLALDV